MIRLANWLSPVLPKETDRTNRETWIGLSSRRSTFDLVKVNMLDQVKVNLVDQPLTGPLGRPWAAKSGPWRAKNGPSWAKWGPKSTRSSSSF